MGTKILYKYGAILKIVKSSYLSFFQIAEKDCAPNEESVNITEYLSIASPKSSSPSSSSSSATSFPRIASVSSSKGARSGLVGLDVTRPSVLGLSEPSPLRPLGGLLVKPPLVASS